MNNQIEAFCRETLKENLAKLPELWQERFKLMYGRNYGTRSVEDTIAMNINDVVDEMPVDKLDWAMTQVDNSIKKLSTTKINI